jgi:glycosyltransferase involved in cell wall biosynthesis
MPGVRLVRTRSGRRPAPNRNVANLGVALELAAAIPAADVIIATYAPTTIPVLIASALGRGRRFWYYADYVEMFQSRPVENWIIHHLPRQFERVLTNSHASVDELRRISGANPSFVGLGLPRLEQLGPPSPRVPRPPVALYVGDSRPRKGLRDFLSAANLARARVPNLGFRIVTKDNEPLPIPIAAERIVRPSDRLLVDLYRTSGVFVSTTWSESLGLPPLEAMACGSPVIVTDQRGSRDYAVDGENCLVVPPRSPRRVAEAVERIIGDPVLARRLSDAALVTAQRYRWDDAVNRFETALRTTGPSAGPG